MTVQSHKYTKVLTGNAAAAHAVLRCRPDVIAAYPITPQSELVEVLAKFHADGILDFEYVNVEGENSAMNVVCAASMAGGRAFTASSSYGLVYMYDALLQTAGYRAPIMMVNVNREPPGIHCVYGGQQDMISTRDSGWVQVIVESNQEIIDTIIMGYRLAEDHDIQLPVMVNYDGYYLSYMAEAVEIPAQEDVDRFLAPLKDQPPRMTLKPGQATGCGTHGIAAGFVEFRKKHMAAMERVKDKWDEIDGSFQEAFGRGYGGQVETYRCDDADIVLVTSGSAAGTAKDVIDAKREEGIKAGLVKLRLFRPFPVEALAPVLKDKKAIGVLDRSICFGWNCGPIFMEINAITRHIGIMPMLSFIDGLANMDITKDHIAGIVDDICKASQGGTYQEVTWLP